MGRKRLPSGHVSRTAHHVRAFTLIELLVVISIMGLIAALAVPALKNLGKSNIQASATRQLLDDIGRARQLAIGQHTTVYMVFVPTNYFNLNDSIGGVLQNDVNNSANFQTPADQLQAQTTMSNLVTLQLTGYNFISFGQVADQPGQHSWHYLSTWQSLPDGTFISAAKFQPASNYNPIQITTGLNDPNIVQMDSWRRSGGSVIPQIYPFTNAGPNLYIPFPTEKSPGVLLPCLAFDYTGKLISEFDGVNYHHAYIPLSQGSVTTGHDANKQPVMGTVQAGDITETPPGNSTSISYNVIDVDPLSGRAKLLTYQIP
jgi:prepilin-type N-terminal cleavage/methylation domain-containing protein